MTVTDAQPARRSSSFGALRHRDFAIFWIAAVISNAGSWMQTVALPAIVYEETGKATWLGLVSLASLVPSVILTPMAGAIADRMSRQLILKITQTLLMVSSFMLWGLYLSGHLTPWWILAISFVNGLGGGLNFPVWNAFIPLLVPQEDLIDAIRLNSMQFTAGRAIGPTAAAAVIAAWGPADAILLNAVTFLLVLGALVVVRPRAVPPPPAHESVWGSVAAGGRFVWRHPTLRMACFIAAINGAFSMSLTQLAPAIANRLFDRPSTGNAPFVIAIGVGAMVAAVITTTHGDLLRPSRQVVFAMCTYGVCLAVLGHTGVYALGLAMFAVIGFAQVGTAVMVNTLVQYLAPEELRGRTVSFYMIGVMAGGPLSSLVTGRIADATTMSTALTINAVTVSIIAAAMVLSRRHRDLDHDLLQPATSVAL
ncbi:MAG: MFS transporter [Acidimicrobiia bacterium]